MRTAWRRPRRIARDPTRRSRRSSPWSSSRTAPSTRSSIGETASLARTLSRKDIELFAVMSGDVNPAHLDEEYAHSDMFHKIIAHGMWGAALISALLGTRLPGPGTIYLEQTLRFRRPVMLGDTITVSVTATDQGRRAPPDLVRLPVREPARRGRDRRRSRGDRADREGPPPTSGAARRPPARARRSVPRAAAAGQGARAGPHGGGAPRRPGLVAGRRPGRPGGADRSRPRRPRGPHPLGGRCARHRDRGPRADRHRTQPRGGPPRGGARPQRSGAGDA